MPDPASFSNDRSDAQPASGPLASPSGATPGGIRDAPAETVAERLDREHDQLFHELRALITGAQVLFAFLLTVAFTERFAALGERDRRVYLAVVLSSALALMLLLAPSAFHRVRFRQRDKDALMRIANVQAMMAMVCISLSTAGSVYLVTLLAFGASWGVAFAGSLLVCTSLVWWLVPLVRRLRDGGRHVGVGIASTRAGATSSAGAAESARGADG